MQAGYNIVILDRVHTRILFVLMPGCAGRTGSTFATDMFAFGRTIDKVKSACDAPDDVPCGGPAVRAQALVTLLCEHNAQKRMRAGDAVEHAFFGPARDSHKTETAECTMCIGTACPCGRVNINTGVSCSASQHFVCASCLESLVREATKPGGDHSTANLTRITDGKIHCPHCISQQPRVLCDFADLQLAKALPALVFDTYLRARMQLLEDRMACEFEAEMQQRVAQVI
jgi:hypothetical protein